MEDINMTQSSDIISKFELGITIQNISGPPAKQNMNIKFFRVPNQYGNQTYMSVQGTENYTIDEVNDLRYRTQLNFEMLEMIIAEWAYSRWTGKNGSWDITKLKIERK